MQLRFKVIAFFILLSLIIIAAYQSYWLINFHREQYQKFRVSVYNAMNFADLNELGMRVSDVQLASIMRHKYTQREEHDDKVLYTLQQGNSELKMEVDTDEKDPFSPSPDSVEVKPPEVIVRIVNDGKKSHMWNDFTVMHYFFQQGFHREIDPILPIHFARYDSLLRSELIRQGIHSPYIIQHIDCFHERVLDTLPTDASISDSARYEAFPLSISETDDFEYRLYLPQPRLYVLKGMSGLVAVSFLMIVLLIISYLYLLRVILRQKTLDELKSDFTNNMTHELKTPVAVAYAATDALQHFGMGDDPVKRSEYLAVTKEQLDNLNNLVEQILTMSMEERRNLKLVPEEIVIRLLFSSIVHKFELHASKSVTFHTMVEPEYLTVSADKIHFRNILDNLVENAIKYSGEYVNITLSAIRHDKQIIISVKDDGIGIPANAISRLFDKFYRVPTGNIQDVRGYGLGLHYVKTIVDKHNWKITVSSTPGKGSTFNIIIP